MDLSIIVPLFNEDECVRPLYNSIVSNVEPTGLNFEILFVDDGSRDDTFIVASELAEHDQRLRIIKFRQNYGQTPAMAAGIEHACGDILVTMDGDLQNDPADIPAFVDKIKEGYDLVVGWRYNRQDTLISRKIPSKIANWIIGKVTGVSINDTGCSLKAYRAKIIKNLPLYAEMHRFIPAIASLTGARIAEIKVRHHARLYGVSKYGLSRIYMVLLDLLTIKTIVSFISQPLFWFSILAIPAALISCIAILFSLYGMAVESSMLSVPIAGAGILFGSLVFFLVLCGALGELIYKTGDINLYLFSALTSEIVTGKEDVIE